MTALALSGRAAPAAGDAARQIAIFAVRGPGGGERTYRQLAVCAGHTGAVTHLGWSADGASCVRTATPSSSDFGRGATRGRRAERGDGWPTAATLYSPQTAGARRSRRDARVRAVGASHAKEGVGDGGRLLAIGDEYQALSLCAFPAPSAGGGDAPPPLLAHAGPLTAVRFSFNDRYVLSGGGEDLCVCVWRLGDADAAAPARRRRRRRRRARTTTTTLMSRRRRRSRSHVDSRKAPRATTGGTAPTAGAADEGDDADDEDDDDDGGGGLFVEEAPLAARSLAP